MPVDLQDIIEYVDEIEDLLRALQNPPTCCDSVDWTDGQGYADVIDEDSANGVPSQLVSSGWATDDNDWDGFMDFQCAVANVLVNNMQTKVVSLEDVFDYAGVIIVGLGAFVSLLGIIFSGGLSVLVGGILAGAGVATGLYRALSDGGPDAVPEATEIELSRQALVCAWLDDANDGLDDRITAFHDAIDAEFNVVEAEILKFLMHRSLITAMYTGKYSDGTTTTNIAQKMVDAGITASTYTCDCEFSPPTPPASYEWIHPPAGSYFWTTNIGSHTESYNETTGELTISVTAGGGDQLEYGHSFADIGSPADDPFEYAYWFELVSSNVPTRIDILYNLNLDIRPAQAKDGYHFAGYCTAHNSGGTWDALVAPANEVVNYSATHQDRIRMVEEPNKTAQASQTYTFTVIVWALKKTV
jgi:hypothetical protein